MRIQCVLPKSTRINCYSSNSFLVENPNMEWPSYQYQPGQTVPSATLFWLRNPAGITDSQHTVWCSALSSSNKSIPRWPANYKRKSSPDSPTSLLYSFRPQQHHQHKQWMGRTRKKKEKTILFFFFSFSFLLLLLLLLLILLLLFWLFVCLFVFIFPWHSQYCSV